MLDNNQDPASLEARLAFHLHRLKLSGSPLRKALGDRAKITTALTQARIGVSIAFSAKLAAALNIPFDELTRDLSQQEAAEWSFYRNSAQNPQTVWANAARFAAKHNISRSSMANVLGIKAPNLSNAIAGRRTHILTLDQARRLALLAPEPVDPNSFLHLPATHQR